MKLQLFLTLSLCAIAQAAPRDVTISFKTQDGKPLAAPVRFYVFDDKDIAAKGALQNGAAQVRLEDGQYSLWLMGDEKARVPAGLWRHYEVTGDGPQKWDLTVPLCGALQGKILRADGKPAAHCAIQTQTGTNPSVPSFYWPLAPDDWARLARGAKTSYAPSSTAADGSYKLAGLVPGNYALDVYDGDSRKWFTIPFAPILKDDAAHGEPTKIGTWTVPDNGWDWLLDKKLHHGGAPTKFDGQGEFKVANGVLRLGTGQDLTGVTWDDKTLPRENYEISLDARRAEGGDFFCGLTFPIGDKPLTWIVGGWGGTVVGLSNVNGFSADENETTQTRDFDLKRWYRLRLRVAKAKIEAWIDDDKVVDLPTADKQFSIRWSVEPSQPLGIATWRTTGEARDIRIRRLDASEIAAIEKSVAE